MEKQKASKRIRTVRQAIRNRIIAHSDEDPKTLKANPLNFRRHPGAQRAALRGSMEQLGWVKAVLVNKTTGLIIDGHARVEEAIKSKTNVPVDWVELTPEEERLALAILDPITEMATRDDEMLGQLLLNLEAKDDGVNALLETLRASIDQGTTGLMAGADPDDVPPRPNKATTKRGQIWQLGTHRLLCGDSAVEGDVARLMSNRKAQMVWTDPPYGVQYVGKTPKKLTIDNDDLTPEELRSFLAKVLGIGAHFTRAGGAWYIAAPPGPLSITFAGVLDDLKILHQTLTWVKQAFVMGRNDYHYRHEPIYYGWKPGAAHTWLSDRAQSTVLEYPRPQRSAEHPTMKPVDLIAYCIENSAKPRAIVLDLFAGSGSTIIACEKTGRTCYAVELDACYCDVIVKRWEEATGKKAVLEAA